MLDARHIIVISVLAVLELDHSKTKILPAESCENVQENRWSFVLSMCVCMVLKFSFVMIMMYIKHPTETINDNINSKTSVWGFLLLFVHCEVNTCGSLARHVVP